MRKISTIVGVIGLVAIVAIAWLTFGSGYFQDEEGAGATVIKENEPITLSDSTADGATDSEPAKDEKSEPVIVEQEVVVTVVPPASASSSMYGGPEFANTELVLQTELPTQPTTSQVYGEGEITMWTIEEMEQIAAQFGFTNGLYQEQYPHEFVVEEAVVEVSEDGEETVVSENVVVEELPPHAPPVPQSYSAFDGTRRLTFYERGFSYFDMSFNDFYGPPQFDQDLSFEEATAIAEAFLQQYDLLDFEYSVRRGWMNEVQFLSRQDGLLFDRPIATVRIVDGSAVASVDYNPLPDLVIESELALISAETAWEQLQEAPHRHEFNYFPSPEMMGREAEFYGVNHWQRKFPTGQELTINSWIQVLRPVDESLPPLILADQHIITADVATLNAIADDMGNMFALTGQFISDEAPRTFEVTDWETSNGNRDVYLNGEIDRRDDGVYLIIAGGLTVLLPDAPDEIEDGIQVGVFGWSISEPEDGPNVFDWVNIDQQMSEPMVEPEIMMGPFGMASIEFDSVDLVHRHHYGEPERFDSYVEPSMSLVPTWRFSGTSDRGETIEFFVKAVDLDQLEE